MIYFNLEDEVLNIEEQFLVKNKFVSFRIGIDMKNKKIWIRRADITENYQEGINRKIEDLELLVDKR